MENIRKSFKRLKITLSFQLEHSKGVIFYYKFGIGSFFCRILPRLKDDFLKFRTKVYLDSNKPFLDHIKIFKKSKKMTNFVTFFAEI